jgi:hypothetical protein
LLKHITEHKIKRLDAVLSKLEKAHYQFAQSFASKEEYNGISFLLAAAKLELFYLYQEVQNKAS